jgi:exodeoxyribonuclease VII large subunit
MVTPDILSSKPGYISLAELQEIIRKEVEEKFPQQIWVTAEVADFRIQGNGHCYLELIEKEKREDTISARVRAMIWSARAGFILPYFKSATGSTIEAGMKILVKVTVNYHPLYGLSLRISDIDPAFTLGEIALKRNLILKRLDEEGVTAMNREIAFPLFPERIAVISSESAAGYTDFINELSGNNQGYRFSVTLFKAAMQGRETSASVSSALDEIFSLSDKFDVVVIVRGGGSQADLSWFDDYDIAFMITQFPLPVITGIGHEKDLSVTDLVSHMHLKTPTAAARFIIDHTAETEKYLNSLARDISRATTIILEERKQDADNLAKELKPATSALIRERSDKFRSIATRIPALTGVLLNRQALFIAGYGNQIKRNIRRYLSEEEKKFGEYNGNLVRALNGLISSSGNRLKFLERSITNLSPAVLLKRGYSITRINGRAITNTDKVKKGDRVNTTLGSGSFESEIVVIKK